MEKDTDRKIFNEIEIDRERKIDNTERHGKKRKLLRQIKTNIDRH